MSTTAACPPAARPSSWSRPLTVAAVALLCCLLWGSSYPAIKSGYALFSIAQADLPGKLVFAGWRFVLAGAFVLIAAACMGKPVLQTLRQHPRQLLALVCAQPRARKRLRRRHGGTPDSAPATHRHCRRS